MSPFQRVVPSFCIGVVLLTAPAVQAKFEVDGSGPDKQAWNDMMRDCKRASRSFRTLFLKIRESDKVITIKLVRNKSKVLVDSYETNEVDLSDLEDLAAASAAKVVDRCQLIAHFLAERWYKAEHPTAPFKDAHSAGITAENAYRTDRGHTDTIQDEPNKRGHDQSDDKKRLCHFWKSGTEKFKTYDAVPGNRAETAMRSLDPLQAPGFYVLNIDPGQANALRVRLPRAYGGGEVVVMNYTGQMFIELSAPFAQGGSMYAQVTMHSLQADAPPVPLPLPPFSTGPNHFRFEPSDSHFGIANLQSGDVWLSYHGLLTNDLFPQRAPLPTYSTLTAVVLPGATSFVVQTASAFLDNEGLRVWSHYPRIDCDGDGLQDYLDLMADPSQDDGSLCGLGADNGVHDDCDCADCNANFVPDVQDILDGTSADCRGNGIPDECDIAYGRTNDENEDGIPDICQGACCHPDGSCTETAPDACPAAVGDYRGDGRLCADVSCP